MIRILVVRTEKITAVPQKILIVAADLPRQVPFSGKIVAHSDKFSEAATVFVRKGNGHAKT